jgi:hypothetical protein
MSYADAIERAIAFRLRAKRELDETKRQALLDLAQEWESWAEMARELAAKGEKLQASTRPAEDI